MSAKIKKILAFSSFVSVVSITPWIPLSCNQLKSEKSTHNDTKNEENNNQEEFKNAKMDELLSLVYDPIENDKTQDEANLQKASFLARMQELEVDNFYIKNVREAMLYFNGQTFYYIKGEDISYQNLSSTLVRIPDIKTSQEFFYQLLRENWYLALKWRSDFTFVGDLHQAPSFAYNNPQDFAVVYPNEALQITGVSNKLVDLKYQYNKDKNSYWIMLKFSDDTYQAMYVYRNTGAIMLEPRIYKFKKDDKDAEISMDDAFDVVVNLTKNDSIKDIDIVPYDIKRLNNV
ncbi:hypothetical protein [Mycoplasma sp. 4044]